MLDILAVPAVRAADALYCTLEHTFAPLPPDDTLLAELQTACVDLLAQTVQATLQRERTRRAQARAQVNRVAKHIAILADVGLRRGELTEPVAHRLLLRKEAVLHELKQLDRQEASYRLPPRPAPGRPLRIAKDEVASTTAQTTRAREDTEGIPRETTPAPTLVLRARRGEAEPG